MKDLYTLDIFCITKTLGAAGLFVLFMGGFWQLTSLESWTIDFNYPMVRLYQIDAIIRPGFEKIVCYLL